jgi:hypothetical protein
VDALRDAVRDGSWEDAVVSLEEIEQVAPSVPRGERELDQAVDALHHAVPPLRHDSAKADPNVPEKSIADLEKLTEDVAVAAERTEHEPTEDELLDAERNPGPPDE